MIGIMGAMNIELNEILKFMTIEETFENSGLPIYKGTIEGKEVVVALSGVGAVKSAMMMTQLLERFDLDCFINIGTAGGLQEVEEELDVIISDRVVKYDFDFEVVYNIPLGFTDQNPYIFKTDKKLQDLAKNVMEQLSDSRVFVGDIVSGDKLWGSIDMYEADKYIVSNGLRSKGHLNHAVKVGLCIFIGNAKIPGTVKAQKRVAAHLRTGINLPIFSVIILTPRG